MKSKFKSWLVEWRYVVVLVLAFISRVLLCAQSRSLFTHPNNYYIRIENGVMSPFRTDGFLPVGNYELNALLFWMSGHSELIYALMLCLLGSLVPWQLMRLGKRLKHFESPGSELLIGVIAATFPPLLFLSGTWRYMLLPVMSVLVCLNWVAKPGVSPKRHSLVAALLFGVQLWIRPDFVLAPVLLYVKQSRFALRAFMSVGGAVGICAVLNFAFIGKTASSGNLWYNIFAGNNAMSRQVDYDYGVDLHSNETSLYKNLLSRGIKYLPASAEYRAFFFEEVKKNPIILFERLAMKTFRLFDWKRDYAMVKPPLENLVYSIPTFFVNILFLIGLGILWSQRRVYPLIDTLIIIVGFAAPMIIFFPMDRTRVVMQAVMLLMVIHPLVSVNRKAVS